MSKEYGNIRMSKISILMILVLYANANDYCKHPTIKPLVKKIKESLPVEIDKSTILYNFSCYDSTYIYYVTLDLTNYTNNELTKIYIFNQNQADSFFKSTKEKIKVRYVFHSLNGTIINIINSRKNK